jgi:hypothetical protein
MNNIVIDLLEGILAPSKIKSANKRSEEILNEVNNSSLSNTKGIACVENVSLGNKKEKPTIKEANTLLGGLAESLEEIVKEFEKVDIEVAAAYKTIEL